MRTTNRCHISEDYNRVQILPSGRSMWPAVSPKSVSTNPRPFHLTFWSSTRSVVAKKDAILRPPAVARRAALARAQSPNARDGTMAVRVLPMPREPPIVPPLVWKQYLLSMEGLWTRSKLDFGHLHERKRAMICTHRSVVSGPAALPPGDVEPHGAAYVLCPQPMAGRYLSARGVFACRLFTPICENSSCPGRAPLGDAV